MSNKFTPVRNWIDEIEKRTNGFDILSPKKQEAKMLLTEMAKSARQYEHKFKNFSTYLQKEIIENNIVYPEKRGQFNFEDNLFYKEFVSLKQDYSFARDFAEDLNVDLSGLPKKLNYLEELN